MKLWGGRFESGSSDVFERFSGSLPFDRRLIDQDIRGSQAFARALERVGILTVHHVATDPTKPLWLAPFLRQLAQEG